MMTRAEFIEQIAYRNLYPWGDDWLQAGVIAAASASSSPSFKIKRVPKVEQYMPKRKLQMRPRQSVAEIKNLLMMGTKLFHGR